MPARLAACAIVVLVLAFAPPIAAKESVLGHGGDEMAGKPAEFAWAFDCAREAGLRLTAHAGEWGGWEAEGVRCCQGTAFAQPNGLPHFSDVAAWQ